MQHTSAIVKKNIQNVKKADARKSGADFKTVWNDRNGRGLYIMEKRMAQGKVRYHVIDAIRGFAVINMVVYHFLYDMVYIFGYSLPWYDQNAVRFWEQLICSVFITVSGMSWNFSRRNGKRGVLLLLCGGVITLVTVLFLPREAIWFGILSFLGAAVLLMIPLNKLFKKVNVCAGMAGSMLLFLVLFGVNRHFVGIGELRLLELPDLLYTQNILAVFGFPPPGFSSSDYFSIVPWFFLFCFGYFLWKGIEHTPAVNKLRVPVPLLQAVGEKSLWIYLLHQPVCLFLLWIFFTFAG